MQIDGSQNASFATALQGMQRSSNQVVNASERIANSGAADTAAVVDLAAGERFYTANARVLETESQMLGTLINTKA
ncbi:MAG: hypothetical protein HLUCCO02_11525 [Idiomarinaceae bacterium HL-53]|nr:MAG: hypothetical protein HLUCCO02_11525 [Idiomarinaceae bacterium HL-53]CUS47569.1 hypothetical protein Ga0003345_0502 [Idiomarinaceae bacterium HL-53]